ncbi:MULTISPECIES: hypothetical protein [Acinetobacter]|uniref:hypothetical protein n=1 Tax=Acinetobacter TaxID=469 RepID=UPI0002CF8ACA|nr:MULTISPECIES: hypothetical protein [Acinetobacter]ENW89461.1 hypothetical protein F905_01244 [Acinetobacter sp. CIP 53.82]MBA0154445.1 hypothetical protein [Acinetobacter indicus]MDM1244334.1 hypothetical protein [Acinetobacter indicus]MDM1285413.1 hypothetical protein [Acinetobacter indicus]MDM1288505.1 hypothetical protein [Acinetobacter indicus]
MDITETVFDFKALSTQQQDYFFEKIAEFDQQVFTLTCEKELKKYLYDPQAISVTIIQYHHRGKLVGQTIIPLLALTLLHQPILVVNSRASFLKSYRHQYNHKIINSALKAMLNQRFKYPLTPMWFIATINQPKLYAHFVSRVRGFYPRSDIRMPEDYLSVLQVMASRQHDIQKRDEDIYVHQTCVPLRSEEELQQLRVHANPHCDFFLQHAPDYFDGIGLMCICRLDSKTLTETALNFALDWKVS